MQRLKSVVFTIGMMLCILSVTAGYVALDSLLSLTPAGSYEDKGVYTFLPYQVLPVQVKNTGATGRYRRMNPTRTAYMVYYRDTSSGGYQWKEEAGSRETGENIVNAAVPIKRRVLSLQGRDTYITVDADLTAESYTAGLQQRYVRILVLSIIYIVFYVAAWIIVLVRREGWL